MKEISGDGEELLTFPTAYPIKVVGRRSDSLRANIDAIVRAHVPDLEDSQITERESNQQHFLSITYTINAHEPRTDRRARHRAAGEQRRDHADLR